MGGKGSAVMLQVTSSSMRERVLYTVLLNISKIWRMRTSELTYVRVK
jgi:hypothetical protein